MALAAKKADVLTSNICCWPCSHPSLPCAGVNQKNIRTSAGPVSGLLRGDAVPMLCRYSRAQRARSSRRNSVESASERLSAHHPQRYGVRSAVVSRFCPVCFWNMIGACSMDVFLRDGRLHRQVRMHTDILVNAHTRARTHTHARSDAPTAFPLWEPPVEREIIVVGQKKPQLPAPPMQGSLTFAPMLPAPIYSTPPMFTPPPADDHGPPSHFLHVSVGSLWRKNPLPFRLRVMHRDAFVFLFYFACLSTHFLSSLDGLGTQMRSTASPSR